MICGHCGAEIEPAQGSISLVDNFTGNPKPTYTSGQHDLDFFCHNSTSIPTQAHEPLVLLDDNAIQETIAGLQEIAEDLK